MMKKISLPFLLIITLLTSLLLGGCERTNSSGETIAGPVSWIDKPHKDASFPLEAIEIIAHSNDPGGVTQVEMNANGNVIASLPVSGNLALSTFTWTPPEAGNYVLRVRAQNASGAWGEYTEANIQVGGPTPTSVVLPVCDVATPTPVCPTLPPTPIGYIPPPPTVCGDTPTPVGIGPVPAKIPSFTPTLASYVDTPTSTLAPMGEILPFFPCISPTPTLAGLSGSPTPTLVGPTPVPVSACESTPTPVCITPTPTPVSSGQISFSHQASTSQFFHGGCNPGQVSISVVVSDPAAVRSVVLFTRLEDKGSGEQTAWDSGSSMSRAGTGRYQITLSSESILNYNTYNDAWLVYQFVATNTNEEAIAHSPRIYDVALSTCGSAPAPQIITVTPVPPDGITPVRPPPPSSPLFPSAP
jgi:hypothetical protein